MRYRFTIFSILLSLGSFVSCYSQANKTSILKYLMPDDKTKCLVHTDSANNVNYILNPESLPQFPGGLSKMEKFILDNAKFDFNIDAVGKIIFEFIVNEKGFVSQINILRGLVDINDNELLRVLKFMPNWKPAICNKKDVPVKMKFSFRMELK